MIELWPFQSTAVVRIREQFRSGARSPLLVSPTGSGKTVMFAYMTRSHIERTKGPYVLICVHRSELVEQVVDALHAEGIEPMVIDAQHRTARHGAVAVASIFSLVRRLDEYPRPTLLILDEAHHAAAGTTWGQIAAYYKGVPTLGVTATPLRLDGGGLGHTFDSLVVGPSSADLIKDRFLCPLRVFAPPLVETNKIHKRFGEFIRGELINAVDRPTITGDAVEHYAKYARGRRAVVFCVSVAHAENMAAAYNAAGIKAFSVDGGLHREVRRERIGAFRDGRVPILTSCDLISEGFDVPSIECGQSLRPTASLGLWLQQVGRCMRRADGKQDAIILDHVGNTLRHGLPTTPRLWSLETGCAKEKPGCAVKVCSQCFSVNRVGVSVCVECGAEFSKDSKPRSVRQKEGQLEEFPSMPDEAAYQRLDARQLSTLEELIAEGKRRGYKNPGYWAMNVRKGRSKKRSVA